MWFHRRGIRARNTGRRSVSCRGAPLRGERRGSWQTFFRFRTHTLLVKHVGKTTMRVQFRTRRVTSINTRSMTSALLELLEKNNFSGMYVRFTNHIQSVTKFWKVIIIYYMNIFTQTELIGHWHDFHINPRPKSELTQRKLWCQNRRWAGFHTKPRPNSELNQRNTRPIWIRSKNSDT